MIQVKNISFDHLRPIFREVSFTVGTGQKIGLAGPNGAGKTTLLRLLTGELMPKEGEINVEGSIILIPQEVKNDPSYETSNAIRDYLDKDFEYDDKNILDILRRLKLEKIDLYEKPVSLSGGEKTRLAMARALLFQPDILLLDEPTNFLDTQGKKWVMDFLSRYEKTLIIVSHDIKLLDKSIDKVFALNSDDAKIEEYKGTYTHFVKLKKEHDEFERRKILNEQKNLKRMEKSLVGLQRLTSDKGVRQRVMLKKRIERIKDTLPPLPKKAQKMTLSLPHPLPIGEIPIRCVEISKNFDGVSVLNSVSLTVIRGEKVAIIGYNGAGKSTFLKILIGDIMPSKGEVIKNENLSIGYYSQELENIDVEKTLIEIIEEKSNMTYDKIRPFLGNFLFLGNKVFQRVKSLSGGEKTRFSIALLLLRNYNLLILDEPTTYLDVVSQRVILEAVKAYKGTLLVVSHTQDFIKELNPSKALLLPEEKVVYWDEKLLERVGYI